MGCEMEEKNKEDVEETEPSEAKGSDDNQQKPSKRQYPWFVLFILGGEFCERFACIGADTVLSLFLSEILMFSEDGTTFLFHLYTMLGFLLSIFGGWIADSFIGNFKTILFSSLIYIVGLVVLTLSTIPPVPVYPLAGALGGLLLIQIGVGGTKPCYPTYGGDQFKPEQEKLREKFFSHFLFFINLGSLATTILSPVLRSEVHCFGEKTCYSLAFGVPTGVMALGLMLLVTGKRYYTDKPVEENLFKRVVQCIGHALRNNIKERKSLKHSRDEADMSNSSSEPKILSNRVRKSPKQKTISLRKGESTGSVTHWLDAASDKYDAQFIGDMKQLMRVLIVLMPVTLFWALFDQMGSRWVLQGNKLDGQIGGAYEVAADEMQILNSGLSLIFVPLMQYVIYPVITKLKIPFRLLARIVAGMILATGSFVAAGFLQIAIDKAQPPILAADLTELRIFNFSPCNLTLSGGILPKPMNSRESHKMVHFSPFPVRSIKESGLTVSSPGCSSTNSDNVTFNVSGGSSYFVFLGIHNGRLAYAQVNASIQMSEEGNARTLFVLPFDLTNASYNANLTLFNPSIPEEEEGHKVIVPVNSTYLLPRNGSLPITCIIGDIKERGPFAISLPDQANHGNVSSRGSKLIEFPKSGYYVVVFRNHGLLSASNDSVQRYTIIEPSSISIFWQVPQYFALTLAEVLVTVSGISFSYSEAPESMRSVSQAIWLSTAAFGNVIVMIFSGGHLIASPAVEFFVFAGLASVATVTLAFSAHFCQYINSSEGATEKPDDRKDDRISKKTDQADRKSSDAAHQKGNESHRKSQMDT